MAEQTTSAEATTKKSGTKTVLAVAVILAVEAVAVGGGILLFVGREPAKVSAVDVRTDPKAAEEERIVETLVLDGRLPNNKSGVSYIYATEIYVQVKKRHVEKVKAEIEQFQNEIKSDITAIWRTAEPQHFYEPKLETLTRKVYALLNDRFGLDKERNEPVVHKVVIVMSTGFRIDG